jgi:hypothetical protein
VSGAGRAWPGAAELHWHGHRLELLPERAVWDPAQGLLLLADVHLGKAECFQASGIPLPSDGDLANLNRLLTLAHGLRPQRVVVLGDLIHSRLGLTGELRQKLSALPELLGCPLQLVGGNHEAGSWLARLPAESSQGCGPLHEQAIAGLPFLDPAFSSVHRLDQYEHGPDVQGCQTTKVVGQPLPKVCRTFGAVSPGRTQRVHHCAISYDVHGNKLVVACGGCTPDIRNSLSRHTKRCISLQIESESHVSHVQRQQPWKNNTRVSNA